MICWFEAALRTRSDRLARLRDGLGFLPGSACPHYDGEERRRPVYRALVDKGFPPGTPQTRRRSPLRRDRAARGRLSQPMAHSRIAWSPARRPRSPRDFCEEDRDRHVRERERRHDSRSGDRRAPRSPVPRARCTVLAAELDGAERRRVPGRVAEIVATDAWVIDGSYQSWIGQLVLGNADVVVWLDFPLRVWLPRLLWRTVRRAGSGEELWAGNRESLRNAFVEPRLAHPVLAPPLPRGDESLPVPVRGLRPLPAAIGCRRGPISYERPTRDRARRAHAATLSPSQIGVRTT